MGERVGKTEDRRLRADNRDTSAEWNATGVSPLGFDTPSAVRWTTQPALVPRRSSSLAVRRTYRDPRGLTIPETLAK